MAEEFHFKRRSKLNRILRFPWMVHRHYVLFRHQAELSTKPCSRWETLEVAWALACVNLRD